MTAPQLIWDEPQQRQVLNAVAKSKPEYRADGIAYLRQNRAPAALIEQAEAIHASLLIQEQRRPAYAPQQAAQPPAPAMHPLTVPFLLYVGLDTALIVAGYNGFGAFLAAFGLAVFGASQGWFTRDGGAYGSRRMDQEGAYPSRGKVSEPTPKTRITQTQTFETW